MRKLFAFALLFMFLSQSTSAQQASSPFAIHDPNQAVRETDSNNGYYGGSRDLMARHPRQLPTVPANQPIDLTHPVNETSDSEDRRQVFNPHVPVPSKPKNETSGSEGYRPDVDLTTRPAAPHLAVSMNPSRSVVQQPVIEVPTPFRVVSAPRTAPENVSDHPPATVPSMPAHVNQRVIESYQVPMAYNRQFFFGIDPKSCCDEWEGVCNCGGLKYNPGHLGMPWLRSDDNCDQAVTACKNRDCQPCQKDRHCKRHLHQRPRTNCDNHCEHDCGSGAKGLLNRARTGSAHGCTCDTEPNRDSTGPQGLQAAIAELNGQSQRK